MSCLAKNNRDQPMFLWDDEIPVGMEVPVSEAEGRALLLKYGADCVTVTCWDAWWWDPTPPPFTLQELCDALVAKKFNVNVCNQIDLSALEALVQWVIDAINDLSADLVAELWDILTTLWDILVAIEEWNADLWDILLTLWDILTELEWFEFDTSAIEALLQNIIDIMNDDIVATLSAILTKICGKIDVNVCNQIDLSTIESLLGDIITAIWDLDANINNNLEAILESINDGNAILADILIELWDILTQLEAINENTNDLEALIQQVIDILTDSIQVTLAAMLDKLCDILAINTASEAHLGNIELLLEQLVDKKDYEAKWYIACDDDGRYFVCQKFEDWIAVWLVAYNLGTTDDSGKDPATLENCDKDFLKTTFKKCRIVDWVRENWNTTHCVEKSDPSNITTIHIQDNGTVATEAPEWLEDCPENVAKTISEVCVRPISVNYNNDPRGCWDTNAMWLTWWVDYTKNEIEWCNKVNALPDFQVPSSWWAGWDENFTETIPLLNAMSWDNWLWFNKGKPCYRIWQLVSCDEKATTYWTWTNTATRWGLVRNLIMKPEITEYSVASFRIVECEDCITGLKTTRYETIWWDAITDILAHIASESWITLAELSNAYDAETIKKCYKPCGYKFSEIPPLVRSCKIDFGCDSDNDKTIFRKFDYETVKITYTETDSDGDVITDPYTLVGNFVDCDTGEVIAEPKCTLEDTVWSEKVCESCAIFDGRVVGQASQFTLTAWGQTYTTAWPLGATQLANWIVDQAWGSWIVNNSFSEPLYCFNTELTTLQIAWRINATIEFKTDCTEKKIQQQLGCYDKAILEAIQELNQPTILKKLVSTDAWCMQAGEKRIPAVKQTFNICEDDIQIGTECIFYDPNNSWAILPLTTWESIAQRDCEILDSWIACKDWKDYYYIETTDWEFVYDITGGLFIPTDFELSDMDRLGSCNRDCSCDVTTEVCVETSKITWELIGTMAKPVSIEIDRAALWSTDKDFAINWWGLSAQYTDWQTVASYNPTAVSHVPQWANNEYFSSTVAPVPPCITTVLDFASIRNLTWLVLWNEESTGIWAKIDVFVWPNWDTTDTQVLSWFTPTWWGWWSGGYNWQIIPFWAVYQGQFVTIKSSCSNRASWIYAIWELAWIEWDIQTETTIDFYNVTTSKLDKYIEYCDVTWAVVPQPTWVIKTVAAKNLEANLEWNKKLCEYLSNSDFVKPVVETPNLDRRCSTYANALAWNYRNWTDVDDYDDLAWEFWITPSATKEMYVRVTEFVCDWVDVSSTLWATVFWGYPVWPFPTSVHAFMDDFATATAGTEMEFTRNTWWGSNGSDGFNIAYDSTKECTLVLQEGIDDWAWWVSWFTSWRGFASRWWVVGDFIYSSWVNNPSTFNTVSDPNDLQNFQEWQDCEKIAQKVEEKKS